MNTLNTNSAPEVEEGKNVLNDSNRLVEISKGVKENAKRILKIGVMVSALALGPTSNALAEDKEALLTKAESLGVDCGELNKPFQFTICQNKVEAAQHRVDAARYKAEAEEIEQRATRKLIEYQTEIRESKKGS